MGKISIDQFLKMQQFKKYKIYDKIKMVNTNDNNYIDLMNYHIIKDCWKDEPCFVVGGGSSLRGFDLKQLDGTHSIGINHIVEDYDGFEVLFFLDDEFLEKTTYDISKLNGTIVYSNSCRHLEKGIRFNALSASKNPSENIEDGLYNNRMSGICALNLAIITGANPIYLLGIDCGGGSPEDYHYRQDYTGATKTQEKLDKYIGNAAFFESFEPWKDRIINCSPISNIKTFRKESCPDFNSIRKKSVDNMKICHVSSLNDISETGDITRHVFYQSNGEHVFSRVYDTLPKADIYLLECMINGNKEFAGFKKPLGSKVISLIHSSGRCSPAMCSDAVISLTDAWRNIIKDKLNIDSIVIPAGIDTSIYKLPDYNNKGFGRITRNSSGKIHWHFNKVSENILNSIDDSYCYFVTNNNRNLLIHDRFYIDNSIKIDEHDKKASILNKISIYADMRNNTVETFSMGLLEAMAAGLCIVLYSEVNQPSMKEVLGDTGIITKTAKEFEGTIKELLNDPATKKEYGLKARERAKNYTIDKMIDKYNKLFKDLMR